jgi:hypothetical protein
VQKEKFNSLRTKYLYVNIHAVPFLNKKDFSVGVT